MPIYEFQCDSCGLRMEKFWKRVSLAKDVISCESCGEDMRKLVSAANFAFKHPASQTRGILPPNTGTSDDHNFDKAIGRDAAQKWQKIEERNSVKDRVIREERKAGRAVTRDHLVPVKGEDGSEKYRVITESERKKANQNRQTAFQVAQAAKKKQAESEKSKG